MGFQSFKRLGQCGNEHLIIKYDSQSGMVIRPKCLFQHPLFNLTSPIAPEMTIPEFKENLGLAEIPTALEKLICFQENISSFGNYADGFGLLIDDKSGLKSWSADESFLEKLLPFAQANSSGSFYTIWNDGIEKPLSEMPIVVFGDEGGVHVVAESILQLLHLITYDTEISVDFEEVYFYKDKDNYKESEDLVAYLEWLKDNYNLTQITDPEALVNAAQGKYKFRFENWFGLFVKIE